MGTTATLGNILRRWRLRRSFSQLDLACEAEISARHLSFVETGRSVPSRDMLLLLAEKLEIPLRDRNSLLLAAGYAPAFSERALNESELRAACHAVHAILAGHEPYPALAYDRHWTLIAANQALMRILTGVDPALLQPPVNVLRLALHPAGLAPRVQNLAEWRSYILRRLKYQIALTEDIVLEDLLRECDGYPAHSSVALQGLTADGNLEGSSRIGLIIRFRLFVNESLLSFISASTIFGTPVDVTLSELAIESFFPADDKTADALRKLGDTASAHRQVGMRWNSKI